MRPKRHGTRAAAFLSAGVALAVVPVFGIYFDMEHQLVWLWFFLWFASVPAVGWGSSHLAMSRGYSSAAGCGLCVAGYAVSGFLAVVNPHPLAFGAGFLFVVLLPTVVLLVLPDKSGASHRRWR